MLRLAAARGLDLVQTARMLAMAHVAGGEAMIACFDAKYHYWFWRPYQAIPRARHGRQPQPTADPTWRPLGATPNFPEYPSAHACHSTAVVAALEAFFGTDKVPVNARQPRHPHDPHVRPPPRHRQGRRPGAGPRGLPLPQLRPARLQSRPEGRRLCRRPLLPAGALTHLGTGGGNSKAASVAIQQQDDSSMSPCTTLLATRRGATWLLAFTCGEAVAGGPAGRSCSEERDNRGG